PANYRKLCTLRIAKNMWTEGEVEDHKLQTLRYTFALQAGSAHRAMGDVITCHSLLRAIAGANGYSFADLLDLGQRVLSPDSRINFGKHKGTKLKNLDAGYVKWLLGQPDMDVDLVAALKAMRDGR